MSNSLFSPWIQRSRKWQIDRHQRDGIYDLHGAPKSDPPSPLGQRIRPINERRRLTSIHDRRSTIQADKYEEGGEEESKRGRGPLALPGQEISHNNNYRSAVNLFFVPIPGRCPLALPLRRAFQQRKTSRHKADRFSRLIHLSWKLTNIVFLISPRHN